MPDAHPPDSAAAGEASPGADWDRFVGAFLEADLAARPTFAVAAGRHDLDGIVPDWSTAGLAAEVARLRQARQTAARWATLPAERELERRHLLARIDGELFWRDQADAPRHNPLFYADMLDPSLYLMRDYAPAPERAEAYRSFLQGLPEAITQLRHNLAGPLPATHLELAAQTLDGLADFCAGAHGHAAGLLGHPSTALDTATERAVAVLQETAAAFRARPPAGAGEAGFRLGAAGLAQLLASSECVTTPLAEIERAGWRELARNQEALSEACAEFAPGLTTAACMTRLLSQKPAEGPVAGARRQLAVLREYVLEHDLVTIPPAAPTRVEEAPPHQRWNSAYVDLPGPYERDVPAIYYIAPPSPQWTAEERTAYIPSEADLMFVSAHEVWPGHVLQFLHAHRAASPVSRLYVTYGFAEGWAHYAEEMLWEAGFGAGRPDLRLGQLLNALLRNVRLLVAIGLHAGDLTIAAAERMFRELAHQDPASARQQAARGTFDPGYLLYTLGKLQIRALREAWSARHQRPGNTRAFHDELLSFGGPPLALVGEAMLGAPPGSIPAAS
jgi:hypothetical protein